MKPRFPLALFLFVWFQGALFVNPGGTVMSDAILSTTVNLVDEGTLAISPHVSIDLMERDGKFYAGFGPGQWLIATPYYWVFRPLIRALPERPPGKTLFNKYSHKKPKQLPTEVLTLQILMVWLFLAPLSALLAVRLYQFLLPTALARTTPALVALGVSVGSLGAIYGAAYSKQWLATLLLSLVALRHARRDEATTRTYLASGFLLGLAVWVDYFAAVGVLLTTLFVFARARRLNDLIPLALSSGLMALLLGVFHHQLVGHPLQTPYHDRIWYDHAIQIQYKGESFDLGDMTQRESILGFSLLPGLDALWGLTFSRFKGLFFFSPFLLFAVAGHLRGLRIRGARLLSGLALAQFLAILWMVSSLRGEPYWSGWPPFFGPRYLMYAVPLLAVGLGHLSFERRGWRWLFHGALVFSAVTHLLGLMYQDINMSLPLDAPEIQRPLQAYLGRVLEGGPRIPLLASMQIPPPLHAVAFAVYVAALAATTWLLLRRTADPASAAPR